MEDVFFYLILRMKILNVENKLNLFCFHSQS